MGFGVSSKTDSPKIARTSISQQVTTMVLTLHKSLFASSFIVLIAFLLLSSAFGQQDEINEVNRNAATSQQRDLEEEHLLDEVSLPADQILKLLRQEPGLTLHVKRELVRKAYEQGRLLDPADLTDAILFKLVEEDKNVRVIATREIQDRAYLRAKPILDESRNTYELTDVAQPTPETKASNQEQRYWETIEKKRALEVERQQRNQTPSFSPPRGRELQSEQPGFDDSLDRAAALGSLAGSSDPRQMSRIRPEELPALFQQTTASGSTTTAQLPRSARSELESRSTEGQLNESAGLNQRRSDNFSMETRRNEMSSSLQDAKRTDYAIRRRANPYANVPSLFDIYLQVSDRQPKLERFGASIFESASPNLEQLPIDLPVGPDYMIGPGDGINVDVWGAISQRLVRTVSGEGKLDLPEVGPMFVAGKTLAEVQQQVQETLRTQFRDVNADVSLSRLRTVRIYVVGDVLHPGAYDISSLSTPLNALYAAGGPTERGSLRSVKHYRGKQLVQQVDLYSLLLHGVQEELRPLQSGDTVLLPTIGRQVKVEGMVRRPAFYELNAEKNLAQILELAGGVLPTGTLRHIEVERIEAHQSRVMLNLDIGAGNEEQARSALEGFPIQDGDAIRISPILPYTEKTVYLDGHVFHPGKYPYAERMKVRDLFRSSYNDLLPEPYRPHAEVIRLRPPDFSPMVMSFNLAEAMNGNDEHNLQLQPFDTIRIFGKYEFEDLPVISVVGEVRTPGPHRTNGVTRLSDAIYLAGGLTREAKLSDVQIFRYSNGSRVKVLSANLGLAIAGDAASNITLEPRDRIVVHRNLAQLDPPSVTILGEVAKPGRYPLGMDMTAADLVRVAGGFRRGAYTQVADLSRYLIENGKRVLGEHQEIPIGEAVLGKPDTDLRLFDGDVLSIRQIAGWTEIGGSVMVKGEVVHPGVYGIQEGERLSSVLRRAGAFRPDAYPFGAVLERIQVKELAEKNRQEMISRIEAGSEVKVSANTTGQEQASILQAALQQQQQVLSALKSREASGRMVINIASDISKWENTPADVVVRPGDVLTIPKQPYFVLVSGQVYNSAAITFVPGKTVEWYLKQAGGPTELANTKNMFVVRANGSIIGRDSGGWWGGDVKGQKLRPGDAVVVPEKFITGSSAMKTLLTSAQVFSQIAFTAAVAAR
jgi:protein involved in polysaccharide export with SLBB domain